MRQRVLIGWRVVLRGGRQPQHARTLAPSGRAASRESQDRQNERPSDFAGPTAVFNRATANALKPDIPPSCWRSPMRCWNNNAADATLACAARNATASLLVAGTATAA
jgi:hypothetical protein